jgi:phage-related protein
MAPTIRGRMEPVKHRRQWRFYKTEKGNCPVRDFLDGLSDDDAAEVVAEMKLVEDEGLKEARHLDGEIYEVRASGKDVIYRILFAKEGRFGQVLLALDGFNKKTQKTPPAKIELAKRRLNDWRSRGKGKKVPG